MPPYSLKEKTPDKEVWGNQGYVSQEAVAQPPRPTCIFPPRRVISEKEEVVRETKQTKTGVKPTLATYKVKKNDSLWKIAQRADVYGNGNKWKKIYEANKEKIKNPNKLRPGIELVIPQD
jgi:nucleoid-associated protein YgaU